MVKYDSLISVINKCLDTLIRNDSIFRLDILKDNPEEKFEFWTDFKKIKEKFIESNLTYYGYAVLEKEIVTTHPVVFACKYKQKITYR